MKNLQFKTYIWEGVLTDYTSGMVVAMGRTKREALAQVRKDAGESAFKECSGLEPEVLNPDKMSTPRSFHVWGGG